jgi:pimeloyl-ACP methyl ester carboxylesterase
MDDITLEMSISAVEVGRRTKEGFLPLSLTTNRGIVQTRYYHAPGEKKAVIYIGGGVGGGFDSPARGIYSRLCRDFVLKGFSGMRIRYRHPEDLVEATLDTLSGIVFLESMGIEEFAIVGHSLGGAVAIQTANLAPSVRTVITLGTQAYGAEVASDLEDTSILLLHGKNDEVLPSYASMYVHDIAQGRKKLQLYTGAGHMFNEVINDVYLDIHDWLLSELS